MIYKVKGIITGSINFSEKSVVLKVFTDQFGLLAFMVPGVRGGKGQIRPSHIRPLSLVELVIYKKDSEGLHRIKELRCEPPLLNLYTDIRKSSIAIFICELLQKSLHEHEKDEYLFNFLQQCVNHLEETTDSIINFPLYFMLGMSRYFGLQPKGDADESGMVLDLSEGVFVRDTLNVKEKATATQTAYIYQLMKTEIANYGEVSIPYQERIELLDVLVKYIQMHLLNNKEIKSHEVLHAVMS
jgi:DNA repair protein RecO (recombination protein O)